MFDINDDDDDDYEHFILLRVGSFTVYFVAFPVMDCYYP